MSDFIVKVEDLSVSIDSNKVIDQLSFSLASGEFFCVLGPNGAGKSTLLKSLLRIVPYAGGTIFLGDKELSLLSQAELAHFFSYVPQSFVALFEHSVFEFVLMARYAHLGALKGTAKLDKEVALDSIELCGLSAYKERSIVSLSGGERQLVLIAAALTQKSKVLLLDEPTTYLDPRFQDLVLQAILRARKDFGISLLIATHEINIASLYANRILALKNGKAHFCGAAESLISQKMLKELYQKDFILVEHPLAGKQVVLNSFQS